MPQKIKISTGYSDKSSLNYQSQQYSVSLDMEVQVNGSTQEIEDASSRLFALCRKIVSSQKSVSVDNLLNDEPLQPAPATPAPSSNNGNGKVKPATKKQIDYIFKLAKKSKLSVDEINALPQNYSKNDFQSLSSVQASQIIDNLAA